MFGRAVQILSKKLWLILVLVKKPNIWFGSLTLSLLFLHRLLQNLANLRYFCCTNQSYKRQKGFAALKTFKCN